MMMTKSQEVRWAALRIALKEGRRTIYDSDKKPIGFEFDWPLAFKEAEGWMAAADAHLVEQREKFAGGLANSDEVPLVRAVLAQSTQHCPVCANQLFRTPSGLVCDQGHGFGDQDVELVKYRDGARVTDVDEIPF